MPDLASTLEPTRRPGLPKSMEVNDLLLKCCALRDSVCAFQTYLASINREQEVDIRTFRNSITSEMKALERLANVDPGQEDTFHSLRSTNLPFLRTIWSTARRSSGVSSFSKRVFPETTKSNDGAKKKGVLVDLIVQEGEEWIKVSTVTERSMLYELAKAGWECGWDSNEEDGSKIVPETVELPSGNTIQKDVKDNDEGKVDLVKVAQELARVSLGTRIRYKHPRIRFVLPNLVEGHEPAVDKVLADIRATGAVLECGPLETTSDSIDHWSQDSDAVFAQMVPSPYPKLTSTLNLDCTILLALISDLSHLSMPLDISHHHAINKQIESEASNPLLPNYLYPALVHRNLKCSGPAARRMREIVHTIGTPDEKDRAQIVLGEGNAWEGKSAAELRQELYRYSAHDVPEGFQLPIEVELKTVDVTTCLPAVGAKLQGMLSEINSSVFLLGWERDWATITSNRTVAKQIEEIIEKDDENIIGPTIWVCGTARSLVGKERRRRG